MRTPAGVLGVLASLAVAAALVNACTTSTGNPALTKSSSRGGPGTTSASARRPAEKTAPTSHPATTLTGMPALSNPDNIYAAAGAGMLNAAVRHDRPLVYVPHNGSGDGIWVIDPRTFKVVAKYRHPGEWQHVVPSYDMRTLYALDDIGNHLIAFDARTGRPSPERHIIDPYNMYNTPDGKYAISVAEARRELVWYNPKTWRVADVTRTPSCAGIDHADFSANGRLAVFSCEFSGRVAVVDVASHRVLRMVDMPVRHTMMGPQDLRLAPDGSHYYIADCDAGGVWMLDRQATKVTRFIRTGRCAHGLYFSRDSKRLFVTNRLAGTISVLNAYTGNPITTWHIPGGGTPDMGNLTADGSQLWLSGRYSRVVYVISTRNGSLIKKIPVGDGPHGLCVWPQPGRYSIGHTGITR
jgi:DNA-binding beta-propeller fold protein YncE